MIRAHRRLDAGDPVLSVRLGFDDRHRRRLAVTTASGERVLIDLAEAAQLRHGDLLAVEDGRALVIEAADEDVADITAPDAVALARLAWHLGNRHTPTAVSDGRLRIRRDHVLEEMVEHLGGSVVRTSAPFDPEPGAYAGLSHGHDHEHARNDPHRRDDAGDAHLIEHSSAHEATHRRDNASDVHHRGYGPAHDSAHRPDHTAHAHPRERGHAHDDDHAGHAHAQPKARDGDAAEPLRAIGQAREDGPMFGSARVVAAREMPAGRRDEHHRQHRVRACGDGADGDVSDPANAGTMSNADERAG